MCICDSQCLSWCWLGSGDTHYPERSNPQLILYCTVPHHIALHAYYVDTGGHRTLSVFAVFAQPKRKCKLSRLLLPSCPGDGWSSRAEDAILHGCIPLVVSLGRRRIEECTRVFPRCRGLTTHVSGCISAYAQRWHGRATSPTSTHNGDITCVVPPLTASCYTSP